MKESIPHTTHQAFWIYVFKNALMHISQVHAAIFDEPNS